MRSRLAVAEKQRQEVLSQLQGLQNKHKPRNLLPAERAQAMRLTEAFVQVRGGGSVGEVWRGHAGHLTLCCMITTFKEASH